MGTLGVTKAKNIRILFKNQIFFNSKFLKFHGQRRALQLVYKYIYNLKIFIPVFLSKTQLFSARFLNVTCALMTEINRNQTL